MDRYYSNIDKYYAVIGHLKCDNVNDLVYDCNNFENITWKEGKYTSKSEMFFQVNSLDEEVYPVLSNLSIYNIQPSISAGGCVVLDVVSSYDLRRIYPKLNRKAAINKYIKDILPMYTFDYNATKNESVPITNVKSYRKND